MANSNLGDQDPELKNSPIAVDDDEDMLPLRDEESEDAFCYFNNEPFAHGTIVQSGTLMLRCELGVWVPIGSSDPDNP